MRVLLTNHHLHDRAGSELYVSELATTLRERGHAVQLFTLLPGRLSEELSQRGFEVHTPADSDAVVRFAPDIAHVHHGPCLWWAGAMNLGCPVIFSSLGVLPPHEAAPPAWPGIALGAAVSEEVRTRLASTPFGKAVELHVMRNWYDDRGLDPAPATAPAVIKRVAVVTNHLNPRIAEHLDALGVEWTHFGLPDNSVEVTAGLLAAFDAVVCIGRTVLFAGALGKPVIVYDQHGCDGVLSVDRLDALASVNFSGRLTRHQPTRDEFAALLDECTQVDVAAVQRVLQQRFTLSARAEEWERLYQRAIDTGVRLDESARAVYRPLFELYWEVLQLSHHHYPAEVRRLGDELAAARQQAEHARAQQRQHEREAYDLRTQLEQSRHWAKLLRGEISTLRAQIEAVTAQLHAPGAEDALRFAEKANVLRTSLLPEGTKRLEAFRTALHWARKKTR